MFHGWIDNDAELAGALGHSAGDWPALYAQAIARWGSRADARIVGSYCAIALRPDGSMRLSRSPWSAAPLAYAVGDDAIMAASVPRALFAAGFPAELNRQRVLDSLMNNFRFDEEGWYKGVKRVPQGTVVELCPGAAREPMVERWYDPLDLPRIRLKRDEDYVEAADALLGEAAGKALRHAARPGLKLSGGLDSPLIAAHLLRQLRPNETLDTFTFVPHADWDGIVPPDLMGDERPFVQAFAAMHPRLRPHFTENPGGGFDTAEREMFVAMSNAPGHLINYQAYHGIWRMARERGCDWLLHAELGNGSYSMDGSWSYREDLVRGHWIELSKTLRDRRGDPRPWWRKLAALSLVPMLPDRLASAARRLVHPHRGTVQSWNSVLRPEAVERLGLIARQGRDARLRARLQFASRDEYIEATYHGCDIEGAEIWQGFEQVYGVRQRDVAAYRPLIEFCVGLPTRQFVSGGQQRWLAKRMAVGKLPEGQRLNPRYGRFQVDWHARLTPCVADLAAEAERIERHPWLGELIDGDRVRRLLREWPAATPWEPEEHYPRQGGIPRAIQAARFVDFVEGRNAV
ncbi:MAG TPA: asparagine synthase-related protein [Novosphingobium sp.]|nr:asparagine synthase-related protein [Novosphingobium sp.]